MEHQQELLIDGKKDWKEIAEIVLTEFYKSVEKEPPEWIKYFVAGKSIRRQQRRYRFFIQKFSNQ